MVRKLKPAEERFMRHVEMVTESGCWLWTGAASAGYGRFYLDKERGHCFAHRFSYERYRGEIPNGLSLDHLCRVPCCVNPWHLEAVTHRENILRGNTLPAMHAKKSHCVNGHELSGDNVYIWNKRERKCRSCRAANERRRRRNVAQA